MSFDRLAPHYRWMEWLLAGEKLQRCRTAFVSDVKSPARILLMGEGNGRFLKICAERFPDAAITVVDASAGMLKAARRNSENLAANRIHWVHRDCLDWDPEGQQFDLIATYFFLDCFTPEQLSTLIATMSKVLVENGAWLIADFKVPDRGWRRVRAQIIHAVMYAFFRKAAGLPSKCVTSPDPYLAASGLRLEKRREWDWSLLHADLWRKR